MNVQSFNPQRAAQAVQPQNLLYRALTNVRFNPQRAAQAVQPLMALRH